MITMYWWELLIISFCLYGSVFLGAWLFADCDSMTAMNIHKKFNSSVFPVFYIVALLYGAGRIIYQILKLTGII